jgi:hypothetical protein
VITNDEPKKSWYKHAAYNAAVWLATVATFFLVPLPWYYALLAAFGTYFLVWILPVMITFSREDRARRRQIDRAMDEYNKTKQSGSTFYVGGVPRPASYVAAQIHHVWVESSAKELVEAWKTRLPADLRGPFADKVRLYCEASVLRVLLSEKQSNPKFEGLVVEFEKLIFPPAPTSEGMTKLEVIKEAMMNLHRLIFEKEKFSWARSWFAGVGHDETNPETLRMFLELLAVDLKLLRELIRDIGPPTDLASERP